MPTQPHPQQLPSSRKGHLKDLLLLFGVPISIVLLVSLFVYVPQLMAKPRYDFIYAFCDDYECDDTYTVDGTGILSHQMKDGVNYISSGHMLSLRYYDAEQNATRSISLADAQAYQLDVSSRSPDGYVLHREDSESGFLFWSSYDNGWVLKNGVKKKGIDLDVGIDNYSNDVRLLGWVTK